MQTEFILALSAPRADLETVGGKGASLARLAAAGFPIPAGFHITTQVYRVFVAHNHLQAKVLTALEPVDLAQPQTLENASREIRTLFETAPIPPEIANAIVQAYNDLPGIGPAVAVRSSATAEDLPEASFAGQQETYLNVRGGGSLLPAVRKCWSSLWTARAIGYRLRQGIPPENVALAVVVQLLVPAEAAGILFTANPLNGQRDQVLLSASWGLGEAIVGGLVTPDNLVVEKSSGVVLNRHTATKHVQTVQVNGGTQEQPVPTELQDVPVLSDSQAAALTRLGVEIETLFGLPMDIEWTLADGKLAILQARPITALPDPEAPVPQEWPLPDPKGRYMRMSIVELMPDPLSPLFESLALPAINHGIGIICRDLMNMPDERIMEGFIMTINGYGYEQLSFTPRQWWYLLSRMVPSFPRILKEGVPYWQEFALPQYRQTAAVWAKKPLADLSASQLLDGIAEVTRTFAIHLASLMASTMGPSAGSEGLFTNLYNKFICREGDPPAPTFLMGFENLPIQGEKALYDLAMWCCKESTLAGYLVATPAEEIARQRHGAVAPKGVAIHPWEAWQEAFQDYLEKFGYAIYDMDFSKPLPMDEPSPLLEMLKLWINGQAKSPYERQEAYIRRREDAMQALTPRLKGLRGWAVRKALDWAQKQAPLRENGLAEIGLGYPVLRLLLKEVGHRLAAARAIEYHDDIYWLAWDELQEMVAVLDQGLEPSDRRNQVAERKTIWRGRKRADVPSQLPLGKEKYIGIEMSAFLAGGEGGVQGNQIKGVPTSPGQVTAIARVLSGPEDFDQMQPGDILVAGITTPAWTPLFAIASGVVTDIGGPLSHGSIVAREYGIPAVLGTGVGTRFIRSGQTIQVDGSAGTVTILDSDTGQA